MTPPVIPNLPPPAHAGGAFGFETASLGEALAHWRAQSPSARCAPPVGRVVVCTAPPTPLGGGYLTQDLTYQFVDGRLSRIAFRASVDAFSWLRARLDQRFGPPGKVVRDDLVVEQIDLPRVRDTWRNGRSTIELDDPERDGATLRVTYALGATAKAPPAS
jgi:hypothetical protein